MGVSPAGGSRATSLGLFGWRKKNQPSFFPSTGKRLLQQTRCHRASAWETRQGSVSAQTEARPCLQAAPKALPRVHSLRKGSGRKTARPERREGAWRPLLWLPGKQQLCFWPTRSTSPLQHLPELPRSTFQ